MPLLSEGALTSLNSFIRYLYKNSPNIWQVQAFYLMFIAMSAYNS